jgi:glycerol-3-phosphate dehydrogenase (NAD(P)+)
VIVTIVGAGMMGSAMAMPLADRGHVVRLVGTHLDSEPVDAVRAGRPHPGLGVVLPEGVRASPHETLQAALHDADAVLVGVSSAGIGWASRALCGALPRALPIAMITKGLDVRGDDIAILPDVLRDALPAAVRTEPVTVGGPCIAGELARRAPTAVVFAGRDASAVRRFAEELVTPYYRPFPSDDVVGVSVSAALKNAYASAVGIASGLYERGGGTPGSVAMHNLEAAVFARAAQEMEGLVRTLGGRAETVRGLAGTGDLFVTTQGGRSTRLGRQLGLGKTLAEAREALGNPTLEGVEIAQAVRRADLPLLSRLRAILFDGLPADRIFETP